MQSQLVTILLFIVHVACGASTDATTTTVPPTPRPSTTTTTTTTTTSPANPEGFVGCYAADNTMTREDCISDCAHQGFVFAGLKYGRECFCSHEFDDSITADTCDIACSGDATQTCGGESAVEVYETGIYEVGCYRDSRPRAMNEFFTSTSSNTIEGCVKQCSYKGYDYAGLQYARECFCGNSFDKYGEATNCNMPCTGDSEAMCGGTWALSVYSTFSTAFDYIGCYADRWHRALNGAVTVSHGSNTIGGCVAYCADRGYSYAGLEYSRECFCGNSYNAYGESNRCRMTCSGDADTICGGPWALSVYGTGV